MAGYSADAALSALLAPTSDRNDFFFVQQKFRGETGPQGMIIRFTRINRLMLILTV